MALKIEKFHILNPKRIGYVDPPNSAIMAVVPNRGETLEMLLLTEHFKGMRMECVHIIHVFEGRVYCFIPTRKYWPVYEVHHVLQEAVAFDNFLWPKMVLLGISDKMPDAPKGLIVGIGLWPLPTA